MARLPIGHSAKSAYVKAFSGDIKKDVKIWGSEHWKIGYSYVFGQKV